MSATHDNTNRFTLFRGKSENPKAPGWTGPIEIGEDIVALIASGQRQFQLAAWFNQNQDGDRTKDRFNGTLAIRQSRQDSAGAGQQAQPRQEQAAAQSQAPARNAALDDDVIPF